MVHRDEIKASVFSINVRNKFADHAFKLGRVSQCRARHLNHDNVSDPFRVILQELLKRAQLDEKCMVREREVARVGC